MTDQDISTSDLPAIDTATTDMPAEPASGEAAKSKRPARRKTPPKAADGEGAASPARRSRKAAKPAADKAPEAMDKGGEVVAAEPSAKKAPARKRAPKKADKTDTSPATVQPEAPVAETPAAVNATPPEARSEAQEESIPAPAAAEDPVPPSAVSGAPESSDVAALERDVEDRAEPIPAADADIESAAEAESESDAPARRKRRRKKRKVRAADEAGVGQAADAQEMPPEAAPEAARQADLPFAGEQAVVGEPGPAAKAAGRIDVIGFSPVHGLSDADRARLAEAGHVLADAAVLSQLALPEGVGAEILPPSLTALRQRLDALADQQLALVIVGDPACEGPGRALLAELGPARIELRPAVGRVQAALARVGLSLDEVIRVDLAAVGMGGLVARLRGGQLYAVTLDAQTRPQDIGRRLEAAGFHQARVWLVEPGEAGAIHALLGFELSDSRVVFAAGTVLAIYTAKGDGSLNDWPGLASTVLRHDALPEALRLLALAWLQPTADETGWAIEPGEAALAIDWSRHRPAATVFAIGSEPAQLAAVRLGLGAGEGLQAVVSGAHRSLSELPDPDLVFIRASEELGQQIRTGWERLRPGGRMVVVAEDEQARVDLMHFANRSPAQRWQEVSVAEGGSHGGRPRLEPAQAARIMLWKKPLRG